MKIATALTIAALLASPTAFAKGGSNSGSYGIAADQTQGDGMNQHESGNSSNTPTDCAPNDSRPACQQATLPDSVEPNGMNTYGSPPEDIGEPVRPATPPGGISSPPAETPNR